MSARAIALPPTLPDPSFKPKKTDSLLFSTERLETLEKLFKQYELLRETEAMYRSYADNLNSRNEATTAARANEENFYNLLKDSSRNLRTSLLAPDKKLGQLSQDHEFAIFFSKVSALVGADIAEDELLMNEILARTGPTFCSFCEDFAKIKEKVSGLLNTREKFLSRASKVLEMNKDKKIILSKLQVIEVERDEIGKDFDTQASEILTANAELLVRTKLDFVSLIMETMKLKAEYYTKAAQSMTQLSRDMQGVKVLLESSKDDFAQPEKKTWVGVSQNNIKQVRSKAFTLGSNPTLIKKLTRNLSFPLEISAYKSSEKKKEIPIVMSLEERAIYVNGKKFSSSDILQITKEKPTLIRFIFRDSSFDNKYYFISEYEAEKCIESYWLLKEGLDRPLIGDTVPTKEEIRIVCATWNMGDAPPDYGGPIESWLPKGSDLYAISTQEADYTPRPGFGSCEDDFHHWILRHLGESFLKLSSCTLMGLGNKGGVGVSFNFYDTSFCFIGSHLAARIDRGRDIISKMPFSADGIHNEFDHLFWFGDLNYRVEIERSKIIDLAKSENWAALHEHDQLLLEKGLGNCFFGFQEQQLNFKPTYRYDRGTREWSDEKMREPAYCDRVMWKSVSPQNVLPTKYLPAHGLMTSDHSPVFGSFTVLVELPCFPHARVSGCTIVLKQLQLELTEKTTKEFSLRFEAPWMVSSSPQKMPACDFAGHWEGMIELESLQCLPGYLKTRWIKAILYDKSDDIATTFISLNDSYPPKPKEGHLFESHFSDKGLFFGKLKGSCRIIARDIPDLDISGKRETISDGNLTRQRLGPSSPTTSSRPVWQYAPASNASSSEEKKSESSLTRSSSDPRATIEESKWPKQQRITPERPPFFRRAEPLSPTSQPLESSNLSNSRPAEDAPSPRWEPIEFAKPTSNDPNKALFLERKPKLLMRSYTCEPVAPEPVQSPLKPYEHNPIQYGEPLGPLRIPSQGIKRPTPSSAPTPFNLRALEQHDQQSQELPADAISPLVRFSRRPNARRPNPSRPEDYDKSQQS